MILRVRRKIFEITTFPNNTVLETPVGFRTHRNATSTHKPPLCKARRGNRSRVSVRVMSVRAASSNKTAEPKYDIAGKQYDLYRPPLTCVLLVHITSNHKNLGSDTTVGERSNFENFPTHTQDHGDA